MQEIREIEAMFPIKTIEVAEKNNLTRIRILQMIGPIQQAGLAVKLGNEWRFKPEAITFVRNRQTTIIPFL